MNFYKKSAAALLILTSSTIVAAQNQKNTTPANEPRDLATDATKNNPTENTSASYNINLHSKLRTSARACQIIYLREKAELSREIERRRLFANIGNTPDEAARAIARAPIEAELEKQKKGYEYVSCIKTNRNEEAAELLKYVNSFKNQNTKSIAKQIFAQWLTVLDSVGESTYEMEVSKLNNIFNTLTVELSI